MVAKILVLNTGSSSVKFGFYDVSADGLLLKGRVEGLGTQDCLVVTEHYGGGPTGDGVILEEQRLRLKNLKHALRWILDHARLHGYATPDEVVAVGHRVVHGADKYRAAIVVDRKVKQDIKAYARFAPLHNPHNLEGIERAQHVFKRVPHVAVFDTAFHQTMPEKAYLYGINPTFAHKHGIRKYGFHGTNHKYCALRAAELLSHTPRRLVTCHLGNGSSVTAIKNGQSIDTSMGFTPTDGLIMGTRSGALDPEVVLYLLRALKEKPRRIDEFLNKDSGLRSIAGSGDVRELHARALRGDKAAILALDMLSYEVAKYVGAYAAALDGLDCLVFTGGIGENAEYIRDAVCRQLAHLGVAIDPDRNEQHAHRIDAPDSKVSVLVIKANEELQIARETRDALRNL